MPNDYLFVRVITPDPQWSSLFNMQSGEGGITQESATLSSYPVDIEGNIEIPYVGKVQVAGKTLSAIKEELEKVFKNYVTDAAITVRMVDNNIGIIGEVNAPGRYPISKARMTIFEALAMAGDLSVYSNRQRIQLIRPSPYGPMVKEFSLSDRSILNSEYYYVMPNDIIYAIPMRGRSFHSNSVVYSLFLTTISTALVIISYFRTL
jgi:polysaccharide export outer membrane protein